MLFHKRACAEEMIYSGEHGTWQAEVSIWIRNFIILLLNKSFYSIQLNLAWEPQDHTLQKFSAIAHVL